MPEPFHLEPQVLVEGIPIVETVLAVDVEGVPGPMLDGGADALYIGRRLIRMATEDIGLNHQQT